MLMAVQDRAHVLSAAIDTRLLSDHLRRDIGVADGHDAPRSERRSGDEQGRERSALWAASMQAPPV